MSGEEKKTATGLLKRIEPDGFGIVEISGTNFMGWFSNTDIKSVETFHTMKPGAMLMFEFTNADVSVTSSQVIHVSAVTSVGTK